VLDLSGATIEQVASPPIAPSKSAVDLAHLFRMTLGDRALEREILQLFSRQTDMLMARMQDAAPASVAAMAHTLKGSARGIGAWRVAHAADVVELAVAAGRRNVEQDANEDRRHDLATAVEVLRSAADETRTAIADLLGLRRA
jgi:HPt (histidine-containing phosphotransfer) domain-containing protein